MKKISLVICLFLSVSAFAGLTASVNAQDPSMTFASVRSGATVEQTIAAVSEYSSRSQQDVHENLISWVSNGLDENADEVGTIVIDSDGGPITYNWRMGSNIMVIWPA